MAESMPEPQPEVAERPAKSVLSVSAAAASLIEGLDSDPDQYGWGV